MIPVKKNKKAKKPLTSAETGKNDPLERLLRAYLDDFVRSNRAAHVIAAGLKVLGIGFLPVIDHLTFRTLSVKERAKEFLPFGYRCDRRPDVIGFPDGRGVLYRRTGYPSILFHEAFEGKKGKGSVIPEWVEVFGDQKPHHIAVSVDEVENGIFYLEKQGVPFDTKVTGNAGSDLRHVFSRPELVQGKSYNAVELVERHSGNSNFLIP